MVVINNKLSQNCLLSNYSLLKCKHAVSNFFSYFFFLIVAKQSQLSPTPNLNKIDIPGRDVIDLIFSES